MFPNYTQMRDRIPQPIWNIFRFLSVGILIALCVLLLLAPNLALFLFWRIVIPLLPLVFFIAPGFWRNVCPLATVNQLPRVLRFSRGLTLSPNMQKYAYLLGIILFLVIVPSRKVLFNADGTALALLLSTMLGLSFIGGILFKGKSGWCSSICPLQPVQRLYGQSPFITLKNNHCPTCVGCTKSCYDVNPSASYLADLHDESAEYRRYHTFFAGAFPGLILGYYLIPNPPTIPITTMYFHFAVYMLVSLGSFVALNTIARATINKITGLYAVLALNLYYWFALPSLGRAIGSLAGVDIPSSVVLLVQLLILALSVLWLVRTYRKEPQFISAFEIKLDSGKMGRMPTRGRQEPAANANAPRTQAQALNERAAAPRANKTAPPQDVRGASSGEASSAPYVAPSGMPSYDAPAAHAESPSIHPTSVPSAADRAPIPTPAYGVAQNGVAARAPDTTRPVPSLPPQGGTTASMADDQSAVSTEATTPEFVATRTERRPPNAPALPPQGGTSAEETESRSVIPVAPPRTVEAKPGPHPAPTLQLPPQGGTSAEETEKHSVISVMLPSASQTPAALPAAPAASATLPTAAVAPVPAATAPVSATVAASPLPPHPTGLPATSQRLSTAPRNTPLRTPVVAPLPPKEASATPSSKNVGDVRAPNTADQRVLPPTKRDVRTPVAAPAPADPQPMTISSGGVSFTLDRTIARVVVIGNGMTGVSAANAVRRYHPTGAIYVVGRGRQHPNDPGADAQSIHWSNIPVMRIDRDARHVVLRNNETIAYDRLILATGSARTTPSIPGFGLAGTDILRESGDARTLQTFVDQYLCRHAVVTDSGPLGLAAAAVMSRLGLHVSILDRGGRLLPRHLDARGSDVLRAYLEGLGVVSVFQADVATVYGTSRVRQALLGDGQTLPCDLFYAAPELRPNIELAQDAGLQAQRGVVVDDFLRTSDPHILAAGDVVEYRGHTYEMWPAPVKQAYIAAINAVGGAVRYSRTMPLTTLNVFSLDVTSIGRVEPVSGNETVITVEEGKKYWYRKLLLEQGRIVGAVLLGYPEESQWVRTAIKHQLNVEPHIEALRTGNWSVLNTSG
jgi:NADPH-dependent 2,4-dienoyl-CoA reductase/sulfur reductase-like enzyme/polyferredoxin